MSTVENGRVLFHESRNPEPGRTARLVGLEPAGGEAGRIAHRERTATPSEEVIDKAAAALAAAFAGPRTAVDRGRASHPSQRTQR